MRYGFTGALVAGILFGLHDAPAKAAEGGIGGYLLGSRASSGAGITVAAAAAGKSIKAKF